MYHQKRIFGRFTTLRKDRTGDAVILISPGRKKRGNISAKKSDIDFKNDKIRLWTRKRKGGNLEFDWMPMTQELKTTLLSWLEVRMSQPEVDAEHIFVCLDKTPFCDQYYGKPFAYRQHFMRRICKKAKVKPFGFHAIRHLAATVQYHNGRA